MPNYPSVCQEASYADIVEHLLNFASYLMNADLLAACRYLVQASAYRKMSHCCTLCSLPCSWWHVFGETPWSGSSFFQISPSTYHNLSTIAKAARLVSFAMATVLYKCSYHSHTFVNLSTVRCSVKSLPSIPNLVYTYHYLSAITIVGGLAFSAMAVVLYKGSY